MRKLKLQMQMSLDGFVSSPDGKPIMPDVVDPALGKLIFQDIVATCDTILLGRKINEANGFVQHWAQQAVSGSGNAREFGLRTLDMKKVMFSRTVQDPGWEGVRVSNGSLVEEVNALKAQSGKDLIVYGGVNFVASLIEHALIDELHLFINPVVLGGGGRIFNARKELKLLTSTSFRGGVVVNVYTPG